MYNETLYHHGIKGMKWGVRRYQNADGTLTARGQKRYDQERSKNDRASKTNDVNRWVKEDLEKRKKTIDAGSNLVKTMKDIERDTSPKPVKKRMDLSKMTDQELRKAINREGLELQYNSLFGESEKAKVSKGRAFARETLDIAGSVLAIGSSSLAIALTIKELKG